MRNKAISVITSLAVFSLPFSSYILQAEEDVDNVFVMNYDYADHVLKATLEIDGNVCLAGFEAELHFDKSKYVVESAESLNSNVMLNALQNNGEVVIMMALNSNMTQASSGLVEISFSCDSLPEKDDFSLRIIDSYMADGLNNEDADYSLKSNWRGLSENTELPVSTKVSSTEDKPSVTTLPVLNSENNQFVISADRSSTDDAVEVTLSVKGKVCFLSADGSISLAMTGLGTPELVENADDAMVSLNDKTIYFAITSSTGKNITDEMEIFKFRLPVEADDYSISCTGKIADIADENMNDADYSLKTENSVLSGTPSQSTVTAVTSGPVITAVTTTQAVTVTTPVTTVPVTEAPELSVPETEISIKNGEQYTIKANQSNLTYKSNNTDVVIVSKNGVITAVGEGNAIVTVINSDSDVVQISVNVSPAQIPGDCNNDRKFDILDVLAFKKWLLNSDEMAVSENADMNRDGITDIFDLIRMKKMLIEH